MTKFYAEAYIERIQTDYIWGSPFPSLEAAKEGVRDHFQEMRKNDPRLQEFISYGGYHIYEHIPTLVCTPQIETEPTLVFD